MIWAARPAVAPQRGAASPRWNVAPRWDRHDWTVVAVVVIVGFGLRLLNYTQAPQFHDNPDEIGWAWVGLSLLTNHVPTSWSAFAGVYPHVTWYVSGTGSFYPLVQPWLDHPPLYALLTGASAWLAGERTFGEVTAASTRLPSIWLGTLSLILSYVLARRLLGRPPAAIGAFLLATAPAAVLFSRSVESEALLAPLLLGALIATHRLLTGEGGRGAVIALLACCVAAPLSKVPGVAVGAGVAVIFLAENRWRLAAISLAGAVAGLVIFAAYGLALNWHVFVAVWQAQTANRSGVMGAFEFIVAPAGLNRPLRDPWWLLGWIGLGLLLWRRRGFAPAQLIAWPVLVYAATMLVMADERVAFLGWYRITVYPLVYLAAGYAVWRAATQPEPANLLIVLLLGGAAATAAWLNGPTALGVATGTLAAIVMAAILIPLALWRRWPRLARGTAAVAVALVLLANLAVAAQLDRLYLQL